MCIIVYKPKNTEMPFKKTLRTCFENNPDGAGFMYAYQGKVHIEKGFDTFGKFWNALRVHRDIFAAVPFVLHFRISTQAGTRMDCTHPFPLSKQMDDLRKLETKTNIGIAHNGIIDLTSSWSKKIDYSDTMKFITDYMSLIVNDESYYKDRGKVELLKKLADSKLAILDRYGHCELIGSFTEKEGIYYSNYTYITNRYYGKYYHSASSYLVPVEKQKSLEESRWAAEADYYHDPSTDKYYFNDYDCPWTMSGIMTYCDKCHNKNNCYR